MKQKFISGVIIKKTHKTIIIMHRQKIRHAKYNKIITSSSKYHVHDPYNVGVVGEKAIVFASKPYSKTKRWILEHKKGK